jgi:hypothetical protein
MKSEFTLLWVKQFFRRSIGFHSSSCKKLDAYQLRFSTYQKKKEITNNLGQDILFLLNYMPSVVSSDAGAGVGYT